MGSKIASSYEEEMRYVKRLVCGGWVLSMNGDLAPAVSAFNMVDNAGRFIKQHHTDHLPQISSPS